MILRLERHRIAHDAMDKVYKAGVGLNMARRELLWQLSIIFSRANNDVSFFLLMDLMQIWSDIDCRALFVDWERDFNTLR